MTKLIPHTDAWFEALFSFNPEQATRSALLILKKGRVDICTLCGAEPFKDYETEADFFDPRAVTTMRLCDDCLKTETVRGRRFSVI